MYQNFVFILSSVMNHLTTQHVHLVSLYIKLYIKQFKLPAPVTVYTRML